MICNQCWNYFSDKEDGFDQGGMCNRCFDEAMSEAECASAMNHVKVCKKCQKSIIENGEPLNR